MILPPPGARIHLIGVAGTAMGALAGLLQQAGYLVSGSDAEIYPPVSTLLAELKVLVYSGYDPSHLDPAPDLVVVGNALSRGNVEVEAVLDRKIPYASLPEVLRELFLRGHETVVVAGTHGKTTVTSLLAWIFSRAELDPGFLIGGLPCNFPRSFRLGTGPHFILEGDEYDTAFFDKGPKFLHYRPDSVLLTAVEFDHADIYRDLEAVEIAFQRLVNLIPRRGFLVAHAESRTVARCIAQAFCPVETFGLQSGDWQAKDLSFSPNLTAFSVTHRGSLRGRLSVKLFGEHNILNALGAIAIASHYGIEWDAIRQALETFQGVRRRMEITGEAGGVTIVDDFAHHPTAIRETVRAARHRFPKRRLWAVLEPRSHTLRRNVLESDLVDALAHADHAVLADVYRPEKIPENERLCVPRLVRNLRERGIPAQSAASAEEIVRSIAPLLRPGDVVLVMSNGGFGGIHQKLLAALAEKTRQGSSPRERIGKEP